MATLSVVLATFNEEKNIGECLASIKDIADEVCVVDGSSTDKTVEIAKSYGAKVKVTTNKPIFHINKQMAIDMATKDWVLQLDADERVTSQLGQEIKKIIALSNSEIRTCQESLPKRQLFEKHQKLLTKRDGRIGTDSDDYAAFFVPRLNYFLGRYLKYGGVYPDGVIRLIKSGKAHFPSKTVHEQIVIEGKVGWLGCNLIHMADPTFSRYLFRWSRYVDLIRDELLHNPPASFAFLDYFFIKPLSWFLLTYIRHKGFMDSWQGFVFSFFSSLRFPAAYMRYVKAHNKD